ncbi:hypothetical protein ACTWP4_00255 [Gracilibacillus sp. D59]
METFWNVTPNHFLKQYIMHLKYNNPDALKDGGTEKQVYTLDETPFL